MEVGFFEETKMPLAAGRFRYVPYRGPGHYKMQTQLRAGDNPNCYYDTKDAHVTFTVRDCPEYGVLELCDFKVSPRNVA
jgi:hypothetical protein